MSFEILSLYSTRVSTSAVVMLGLIFGVMLLPLIVYAQYEGVDIAKTYVIADGPANSGDIISFDRETQQFRRAREPGESGLFGVAAREPLLVLETDAEGIPVVRTGEVFVNVTTGNGPIEAGDYLTSSFIAGWGQRAGDDHNYVIGIALEPLEPEGTIARGDGSVDSGAIRVLLGVGTREAAEQVLLGAEPQANTGFSEATVLNVIQYLVAAFIAVGSVVVAFKNFGPSIRDGIVSVGRNPLARSSIQSMVVVNAVLIVLISAGGLFVSVAILLLPI